MFLLFYFCLYRLNFFFKSRAKGKLFSLSTTSDDTYVVQYSVHEDMEPLFLQRSTDCVSHESPDNLFSFPRVILFVFSMDDSFFPLYNPCRTSDYCYDEKLYSIALHIRRRRRSIMPFNLMNSMNKRKKYTFHIYIVSKADLNFKV